MFTQIPRPITLEDDVAIGTIVTNLTATDSDGTAPGNQVIDFYNDFSSCHVNETEVLTIQYFQHNTMLNENFTNKAKN